MEVYTINHHRHFFESGFDLFNKQRSINNITSSKIQTDSYSKNLSQFIHYNTATIIHMRKALFQLISSAGKLMGKLFIQRAVNCKDLLINFQFFTSFALELRSYLLHHSGNINEVLLIFGEFISKPFQSLRLDSESFCTIQQQIMIIGHVDKQTNNFC